MNVISAGMFTSDELLNEVVMPEAVVTIKEDAFYCCTALTTISFPNTLKQIEKMAFHSSGVKKVNLPESMVSIGDSAFQASALEEIYIPASITELFDTTLDCSKLQKIYYGGKVENLKCKGNNFAYDWTGKVEHVDVSPLSTLSLFSLF